MGRSSRLKGVRGELEVRDVFRRFGHDVDRTPNSGGLRIRGDLYGAVPVHLEVKYRERLNVQEAFRQAAGEAAAGLAPAVALRSNRSPWLGVVELELLAWLLAAVDALHDAAAVAADSPEHAGCSRILTIAAELDDADPRPSSSV